MVYDTSGMPYHQWNNSFPQPRRAAHTVPSLLSAQISPNCAQFCPENPRFRVSDTAASLVKHPALRSWARIFALHLVDRQSRTCVPNVGCDVPRISERVENSGVPIPVRLVGRLLNRLCARSKRTAIDAVGVRNI